MAARGGPGSNRHDMPLAQRTGSGIISATHHVPAARCRLARRHLVML
jgi:hypothetical protein